MPSEDPKPRKKLSDIFKEVVKGLGDALSGPVEPVEEKATFEQPAPRIAKKPRRFQL